MKFIVSWSIIFILIAVIANGPIALAFIGGCVFNELVVNRLD